MMLSTNEIPIHSTQRKLARWKLPVPSVPFKDKHLHKFFMQVQSQHEHTAERDRYKKYSWIFVSDKVNNLDKFQCCALEVLSEVKRRFYLQIVWKLSQKPWFYGKA